MRIRYRFWLNRLTTPFQNFGFTNITNPDNCEYDIKTILGVYIPLNYSFLIQYIEDETEKTLNFNSLNDFRLISSDETYIDFDCDYVSSMDSAISSFIQSGILEILNIYAENGETPIVKYKQNSENDALTKELLFVGILTGKFNQTIGLKNLTIDVKNYARDYNYVFIPSLNRYYYVDRIDFISADFTRLYLKEDVLMSWKNLIKQQVAFVTRSESDGVDSLVDTRLPLENIKSVEYITPTHTSTGNLENITLKGNFTSTEFNILISTMGDNMPRADSVTSPDTDLPNLSPNISRNTNNYFVNYEKFSYFLIGIKNNDNLATFVNSVVFLPFNPLTPYNLPTATAEYLSLGTTTSYYLAVDHYFHDFHESPSPSAEWVKKSFLMASPYLILADIQMPNLSDDWKYREPYSVYEIYIAFVGWVKVDITQINNKRILIYYTLDYITGNATAYLYNKTDGKIIYSCNCQLGIKLDILTTNALELSREKQASQLNTLIGLLASGVSIGAGVISENPVAIAGGVLSASKTIANAVNRERMMFERAQVTYGSGDAGLHSNLSVRIRRTYYKELLDSDGYTYFHHIQGKPTNYYGSLTGLSGYVEVGEIHFNPNGENIYQDEIVEIVDLLQKGVIF